MSSAFNHADQGGEFLGFLDSFSIEEVKRDEEETRRSHDIYITYISHVFNELSSRGIRPKIVFHSLNKTSLTDELFSKVRSENIDFFNKKAKIDSEINRIKEYEKSLQEKRRNKKEDNNTITYF